MNTWLAVTVLSVIEVEVYVIKTEAEVAIMLVYLKRFAVVGELLCIVWHVSVLSELNTMELANVENMVVAEVGVNMILLRVLAR